MEQSRVAVHFACGCRLYREQLSRGRYFLHEQPTFATSWKVKCMDDLAKDPMVLAAEIDQCAYGLTSKDMEGEAPADKPTRFLTNSTAPASPEHEVPGLQEACPACRGAKQGSLGISQGSV